jgi:hypothetical protein
VTPTVLSNERIVLKVAPEASDLDYTNALSIDGVAVPAITTRRADTTVELGDGESFIIGGLVSRTTSSNVDKVPLLGDIPVLGSFFRQNKYQMNEKELVIMVTPHLVKPIARDTDLRRTCPAAPSSATAPCGAPSSWVARPTPPCPASRADEDPLAAKATHERSTRQHPRNRRGDIPVRLEQRQPHHLADRCARTARLRGRAGAGHQVDRRTHRAARPGRGVHRLLADQSTAASQLHQRLKRDWPTLPVLATGVSAEPAAMLAALRAGVDDFVDMAAPPADAVSTLQRCSSGAAACRAARAAARWRCSAPAPVSASPRWPPAWR